MVRPNRRNRRRCGRHEFRRRFRQDQGRDWRPWLDQGSATGTRTAGDVLPVAGGRRVVGISPGTHYRPGMRPLRERRGGDGLQDERVGSQDGNDAAADRA
jgi:hypothetical protein